MSGDVFACRFVRIAELSWTIQNLSLGNNRWRILIIMTIWPLQKKIVYWQQTVRQARSSSATILWRDGDSDVQWLKSSTNTYPQRQGRWPQVLSYDQLGHPTMRPVGMDSIEVSVPPTCSRRLWRPWASDLVSKIMDDFRWKGCEGGLEVKQRSKHLVSRLWMTSGVGGFRGQAEAKTPSIKMCHS